MSVIKMAIVGTGSRFAFSVVSDLMRYEAFEGNTVALVDTDAEALDLSTRVVTCMVDVAGVDVQIESSTNRRDVLDGCDFVLNSISVGETAQQLGRVITPELPGVDITKPLEAGDIG